MSEIEASKRPRKVVNYAAMESLDISDDDEFCGFSSPASRPPHRKPSKSSSKTEKSKLQQRKLPKQSDEAGSEATPISDTDDSDSTPCRSAPRPRPPLHEKIFQRDLEAALELSRQCAGVAAPDDNKENVADSFSPPRPLHSSTDAGITPIIVPVEVHGPKSPPSHPSPVCRKGNSDVRILSAPTPHEVVSIEQIDVLGNSSAVSDVAKGEQDKASCLAERSDDCDATVHLNGSKFLKSAKRKANVIESDDDDDNDFNTTTHPTGVTSTLIGEVKKKLAAKDPSLLVSKPIIEKKEVVKSTKDPKPNKGVHESNSAMKGEQSTTLRQETDHTSSGRGKRTLRAVSFLPEPDSESEDEWAEPAELDEDDLSASEGSDFEPSPKKSKKKKTPSKKLNISTKTLEISKTRTDTMRRPKVVLNSSDSTDVGSATPSPRAYSVPLPHTRNTATRLPMEDSAQEGVKSIPVSNKTPTSSSTSFDTQPVKPISTLTSVGAAASPLPRAAPSCANNSSTLFPPRAGLARAAFKCPVMSNGGSGASPVVKSRAQASSMPSGTLRLGLSRKACFKPLHPNATGK